MKKILLIIMLLSSLIWGDRFTRDANGIVTDNSTHLQWQDDYSDNANVIKNTSWESAISYCEALDLDGTGWRLPHIKELFTIVDYTQYDPTIDPVFQYTMSFTYWSSTTSSVPDRLTYVQDINFQYGYANNASTSKYLWHNIYPRTRCVRGRE